MSKESITIWNRIEGRPRSQQVDRSLRGEIRDPLWLLTRQWQFGEFLAEDTGSAVFARVNYLSTQLDKLSLKGQEPEKYLSDKPLEARVEQEETAIDLRMRIEMGRHWKRMLRSELSTARFNEVFEEFQSDKRLHFRAPRDQEPDEQYENAELICNENYMQLITAVARGRMIDGGYLYLYLKDQDDHFASDFMFDRDDTVDQLGDQFVAWFERVYGQKNVQKSAWHASHLEYQFDCTAPAPGNNPKLLRAEEYQGGRLDWYSFDYDKPEHSHEELGTDMDTTLLKSASEVFLPNLATYPGMPSPRFWEMEDRTINFGDIQGSSADSGKLVFAQYGLLYGNDWMNFPLELPLGSMTRVKEVKVTDVFGQLTIIPHLHDQKQDEYWGMFQLHDRTLGTGQQNDCWMLLPPVANHVQKSKALEKVTFIRDEMANMVWAVEGAVPDGIGNGIDAFEQATKVKTFREGLISGDTIPETLENEAKQKYVLATTVPENWIPFIPVKVDQENVGSRDIQLQRAAMPRIVPGFPTQRIRPQTSLLREGGYHAPYYIIEEEVPRSGAVVELVWKRARWHDGRIVVWLGRKKTNGRGEQSSGLRYDQLETKA